MVTKARVNQKASFTELFWSNKEVSGRCSFLPNSNIKYGVRTHMSQKAAGHHGRFPLTLLQLWQKVVTVEVMQLLQVSKDDASLAPKILGNVLSVQQREVVSQDVIQWADILPLCDHQLFQHPLQPPETIKTNRCWFNFLNTTWTYNKEEKKALNLNMKLHLFTVLSKKNNTTYHSSLLA